MVVVAVVLRVYYGGGGVSGGFPVKDSLLSVCGNFGLSVPCKPIDTGIGGGMRKLGCQTCGGGSMRFLGVLGPSKVHACIHSLYFVLYGTIRSLCPSKGVVLRRPMSGKCCYTLRVKHRAKLSSISHVGRQVGRVIRTGVPFRHFRYRAARMMRLFHQGKVVSGIELLRASKRLCSCCCALRSAVSCCCNDLLPDAKCVHGFSVIGCCSNLLLQIPGHRGPRVLRRMMGRRGVLRMFGRRQH